MPYRSSRLLLKLEVVELAFPSHLRSGDGHEFELTESYRGPAYTQVSEFDIIHTRGITMWGFLRLCVREIRALSVNSRCDAWVLLSHAYSIIYQECRAARIAIVEWVHANFYCSHGSSYVFTQA